MDKERVKKFIQEHFNGEHTGKHYLFMTFETEMDLGISNTPNRWECTGVRYFTNGTMALETYANVPNPASQLVDARTEEGLVGEAMKTLDNMKDEAWLDRNLYPYL